MHLTVVPADPLGQEALGLLAEAAAEARLRYPEFFVDGEPPPTNAPIGPRSCFVLAHLDGAVVGCGALRPRDATTAEIKRMFVRRAARRQGEARAIVAHLVHVAGRFGYRRVRLETGDRQPEAIALDAACGFARIAAFGPYVDAPTCVCFERVLEG